MGLLLGLIISTQGCALCVRGDEQDVELRSNIPDIRVEVDGVAIAAVGSLPSVTLDRNRVHLIRAEAPGYDPMEVTLVPCMNEDWLFAEQCTLWPVLWLPMALDLNTGALNDLVSPVDLNLKKTPPPPPAPANAPNTVVQAAAPKVTEIKLMTKKPGQVLDSVSEYRTARMEGIGLVVPETPVKAPPSDPLRAKLSLRDYTTSRMDLDDGN
ncbi:MAG TPA: hypothetical protein VFF73_17075 [Planctomycetota bacterium]|nr:hypothetical protein [Planctomycetota bacterium]